MNIKQLSQVMTALDTFDHAAQSHGWHEDQGSVTTAHRAKRLYKAAKTRLVNMLKDFADVSVTPVAQGEAPVPPAAAVKELRRMGYSVAEWVHSDGWWVGYAHHDNPAICTISEVTGKAFIEVCKPHAHATINLPPRVN